MRTVASPAALSAALPDALPTAWPAEPVPVGTSPDATRLAATYALMQEI